MQIPRIAYVSGAALIVIVLSMVAGLFYIRTYDKPLSRTEYIRSLQTNR